MPIMTNAEAFRYDFGMSAIDLWQMNHENFLKWLNATCDRERPRDMIVRCKDCKYWKLSPYNTTGIHICGRFSGVRGEHDFCSRGERKDKFEEPEINPCRGCSDYDGRGGCISNGGCGERKDDETDS